MPRDMSSRATVMLVLCVLASACSSKDSGDGDESNAEAGAAGGDMEMSGTDGNNSGSGGMRDGGSTDGSGGMRDGGSKGGSGGMRAIGGSGGTGGSGGMDATGGSGGMSGSGGSGGMDATGGTGGSGLSVTDDFERATLGPNWLIVFPTGADQALVKIFDDSDLGLVKGKFAFLLVDWKRDTFSADQYCEATIPADLPAGWAHMVYVRSSDPLVGTTGRPRYGFAYDNDMSQPDYGNWIFKYDGVKSDKTRVFGQKKATTIPMPGDTLRVEIVGYTLKGYLNGDLVIEATDTDASKIANGRPGLATRLADFGDGTLNADTKLWESFAAGDM